VSLKVGDWVVRNADKRDGSWPNRDCKLKISEINSSGWLTLDGDLLGADKSYRWYEKLFAKVEGPLDSEAFWNGRIDKEGTPVAKLPKQLPEGTRVEDAVTGEGPYFILPVPLDDKGRVAVYAGDRVPAGHMLHRRMWCSALRPVPAPLLKIRDWDQLVAYGLGGVISGIFIAILHLIY